MNHKLRGLTRTGLLIALTAVFQSLRLFMPMPSFLSMVIVGSLVNACILLAAITIGKRAGIAIAMTAPIVAWLQQMLATPVFIFPVAVGNIIYIVCYLMISKKGPQMALFIAAALKAASLYLTFYCLLTVIESPAPVAAALLKVMGWPQLVTATLGGGMAMYISKRINSYWAQ